MWMCACAGGTELGTMLGGRTVYKRGSSLLYKLFPLMEMGMCLYNKIY